jgi:hypothetical protein
MAARESVVAIDMQQLAIGCKWVATASACETLSTARDNPGTKR